MNGGQQHPFTPAGSLYVNCTTQEEVDELWTKLIEGGKPGPCDWLEDRYGLSWQIIPDALPDFGPERPRHAGDARDAEDRHRPTSGRSCRCVTCRSARSNSDSALIRSTLLSLTHTAARRLHVAALGLDRRPRRRARKSDVLAAIRRMGTLQIDTINVVARSPYLVLFSRLGAYEPEWLDELLSEGALFEYWAHEACFLPIEHYPLFRHRMLDPAAMGWKYRADWVAKHRDEVARVLEFLEQNGAARSADFERRDGAGPSGWWGWKPEKRALEALFTAGEVMVARRQTFQRVYDLRTRVHPTWDDAQLPERAEVDRRLILDSVRALGITTARWVGDYYRMPRGTAPHIVEELATDGGLLRAQVHGWKEAALVHPDNAELAERAASGRIRCTLTTVLSPFDPLVWDRARARALMGFDYSLECYTPAPKRRYGYYVLPVLRRGELVARLDAKAHRQEGRFEVKALYLEPTVRESDALAADVAGALDEVADWHGTPSVQIRRTEPASFKALLLRRLEAR